MPAWPRALEPRNPVATRKCIIILNTKRHAPYWASYVLFSVSFWFYLLFRQKLKAPTGFAVLIDENLVLFFNFIINQKLFMELSTAVTEKLMMLLNRTC